MVNYTLHKELMGRVAQAFNKPALCDVTVVGATGEKYHCLKFMLYMGSGYFKEQIQDDPDCTQVTVEEVDTAALGQMLRFLHTGECDITDENVIPLLSTSVLFKTHDLQSICEEYKKQHLMVTERNCCFLLEDALDFGAQDIADECYEFISRNMQKISQRTEFLMLDPDILRGLVHYADSELFRWGEVGRGHLCMWFVLGLIKWLERDLPNREHFKMDLIWGLDLTVLSADQLACLCRADIVRRCPELSMCVIDAMAAIGDTPPCVEPMYGGEKVKVFSQEGVWEQWWVERSGWYNVVAKSRSEGKPGCVKIYRGLCRKMRDDERVCGGGFYLERGDEVRTIVGSGKGPSCVIVKSRKSGKDQMVMVAGGELDLAFGSGEEAARKLSLVHYSGNTATTKPSNLTAIEPHQDFSIQSSALGDHPSPRYGGRESIDRSPRVESPDSSSSDGHRRKEDRDVDDSWTNNWDSVNPPTHRKEFSLSSLNNEKFPLASPEEQKAALENAIKSHNEKSRQDTSLMRRKWKKFVGVVKEW